MIRVGIIDNYDSFTYNLVQLVGSVAGGATILVWRHDAVGIDELESSDLSHLIISPGPGTPEATGISIPAIRYFSGRIPVLGVCLGQQCIAAAWGGKVVRAPRLMHGKTSQINHDGLSLFVGLRNPFTAARYHSLIVDRVTLPDELEITAWTAEDEIMGIRHRSLPLEGVQFHPESFMTAYGSDIVKRFLVSKSRINNVLASDTELRTGLAS